MTHFSQFVSAVKNAPTAKALALLAAVTIPAAAMANGAYAAESHSTRQEELAVKVLQAETDQLVKFTQRFLNDVRYNPAYSDIYSRNIKSSIKLDLVQAQLADDFDLLVDQSHDLFPELEVFDKPADEAALASVPDLKERVRHMGAVIDALNDTLISISRNSATRAGDLASLQSEIHDAQSRLAQKLDVIDGRFSEASLDHDDLSPRIR
jgi:hypothetical protein